MPYKLQRGDTAPTPGTINRLGGSPIGISQDQWPTIWDEMEDMEVPMVHVLTIDANSIGYSTQPGIRAFALFASNADMFIYMDDPTADLEVVALTQQALDKGELEAGPDVDLLPSYTLILEHTTEGLKTDQAGGKPSWIQDEGPEQGLILQGSDDLLGLNLGDCGQLYMYENWAMWQSH